MKSLFKFVLSSTCLLVLIGCGHGGKRIIYTDSQGRGYHSASELPRVYMRPGQVFRPGPDVKYYIMTNDTPLPFNTADYPNQYVAVKYLNPGEESMESGNALYVYMPKQYDTSTCTPPNPDYSPPQQTAAVQPQPQVIYVQQPPAQQPAQQQVVQRPRQEHGRDQQPRDAVCPVCGGIGRIKCTECHGAIYLPGRCANCGGSGKVTPKFSSQQVGCPLCGGTGRRMCQTCTHMMNASRGTVQCPRCNGTGKP